MRRATLSALAALACGVAEGRSAPETTVFRLSSEAALTNAIALRIGAQLPLLDPAEELRLGAAQEALRKVGVGFLRWPSGCGWYNWYDGVGPRRTRRLAGAGADTNGFGTAEYVAFCAAVGAEPLIRAPVALPGRAAPEAVAEGAELAADWVSYCNATNDSPLAALRRRHGLPEALRVRFWEADAFDEGTNAPASVAGACRAYVASMRGADPSVVLGVRVARVETAREVLAQAGGSIDYLACGAPGVREAVRAFNRERGRRVAWSDASLGPAPDPYVAEVLGRLAAAPAERAYFAAWYEALGLAQAALGRVRLGAAGACCGAWGCGETVRRAPGGAWEPTERGLVQMLVNRFPVLCPLPPPEAQGALAPGLALAAAWSEDPRTLVLFIGNAGPVAQRVAVDLSALNRRFAFWTSEQLSAEIAKPRASASVPVVCRQKVGSALRQAVEIDCPPASFTRVAIKE